MSFLAVVIWVCWQWSARDLVVCPLLSGSDHPGITRLVGLLGRLTESSVYLGYHWGRVCHTEWTQRSVLTVDTLWVLNGRRARQVYCTGASSREELLINTTVLTTPFWNRSIQLTYSLRVKTIQNKGRGKTMWTWTSIQWSPYIRPPPPRSHQQPPLLCGQKLQARTCFSLYWPITCGHPSNAASGHHSVAQNQ